MFGYLRDRDTCCCLENPLALANIRSTSAVWSTEAGSVGKVRPFKVGFTAFATPKRILSLNRDFATSRRDARQLLVGQDCVHPGELATKVRYFGVKSTKVLREQMGT